MEQLRQGGYGMFGVTMLFCLPAMLDVFVAEVIPLLQRRGRRMWCCSRLPVRALTSLRTMSSAAGYSKSW